MLTLELVPNRSTAPTYTRLVTYEPSAFVELETYPVQIRTTAVKPVRRLVEPINGRMATSRVTEVPYAQIARESATEAQWAESDTRTHKTPKVETRFDMIADGRIETAGSHEPCLGLTDMDWIRAERVLAGLDTDPESDEYVVLGHEEDDNLELEIGTAA